MGQLISFPGSGDRQQRIQKDVRRAGKDAAVIAGSAKVLLFTGVRYERLSVEEDNGDLRLPGRFN